MKVIKRILIVILPLLVWTAFVAYGFIDGFLLKPLTSENTAAGFVKAAQERVASEYVGNFAIALIEDGEVSAQWYFSEGKPVDTNTLFPVASISKWVSSFGVMKLVEQGKIDLDTPVDDYLTRWNLPSSEYDNKEVTVRRLLSHSSGLIDDLGYNGFPAGKPIQSLEASLTKAADTEYSDGRAIVGYEPGSRYMYSGAGYTLLQLLIEEVSGQSFPNYMKQEVFEPLGMKNSTFDYVDPASTQLAQVFQTNGETRVMNRFTALAAAGLYTTTADLSRFLKANVSNNKVLSQSTLDLMTQPTTFINNIGVYGLGPHLYSQNDPQSHIVGHDGSGNDAINTAARIDLTSKSGIIVLETGNWNMASGLADEWIFWKADIADYVVMQRNKSYVLTLLLIGYVILIGLSVWLIRKKKVF